MGNASDETADGDVEHFLHARGVDFVSLENWTGKIGNDLIQVGIALKIAFGELRSLIPLYERPYDEDPGLPVRLDAADAAAAWSDVIENLDTGMMPDVYFGLSPDEDRSVCQLYLLKSDCNAFAQRTGIGRGLYDGKGIGQLEAGELDIAAARQRVLRSLPTGGTAQNAVEADAAAPPYFDADSEEYPALLHIAVRAWEHAKTGTTGTPKQRILAFVAERYPQISEGAREAIGLIANWSRTGGRPKSGG